MVISNLSFQARSQDGNHQALIQPDGYDWNSLPVEIYLNIGHVTVSAPTIRL